MVLTINNTPKSASAVKYFAIGSKVGIILTDVLLFYWMRKQNRLPITLHLSALLQIQNKAT